MAAAASGGEAPERIMARRRLRRWPVGRRMPGGRPRFGLGWAAALARPPAFFRAADPAGLAAPEAGGVFAEARLSAPDDAAPSRRLDDGDLRVRGHDDLAGRWLGQLPDEVAEPVRLQPGLDLVHEHDPAFGERHTLDGEGGEPTAAESGGTHGHRTVMQPECGRTDAHCCWVQARLVDVPCAGADGLGHLRGPLGCHLQVGQLRRVHGATVGALDIPHGDVEHARHLTGPVDGNVRNTSSNVPTNFESRSRIRRLVLWSSPSMARFRACRVTQAESGWAVTPARWTRRAESSMKNRTYSVFSRIVSTR